MVPAQHPVPPLLRKDPFHVTKAYALHVSRDDLRGPRFRQLRRGVYEVAGPAVEPSTKLRNRVIMLARAYAPLLRPGEAFSHTTALLMHKVPIRAPVTPHVSVPLPANRTLSSGIVGHRVGRRFAVCYPEAGLPCVSPVLALLQSGPLLSFRELVVAIDDLIKVRRSGGRSWKKIERIALGEILDDFSGRGALRLRAAFEVSRTGAESRYETLTHFELARMGIDELELQARLWGRDGRWIGRFDQMDRAKKRILEYDGEQHRLDRKQYLRDLVKLKLAAREGYEVLRLHYEDFYPRQLEQTRRTMCDFLELKPRPVPQDLSRYFDEPY